MSTGGGPEVREFARARHLFFALVAATLFVWLDEWGLDLVGEHLGPERRMEPGVRGTFNTSLRLLSVLMPAWLALVVFNTNSEVTLFPKRWHSLGWDPLVLTAGVVLSHPVRAALITPEIHFEWAMQSYGAFFTHTGLQREWLVAKMLMGVATEEILFRVLLQRAFEGYMKPGYAVVAQAILFQFAHSHLYGYGFFLMHGIVGLILGIAFMRTRSFAAPLLLHLVINTSHAVFATRGAASMF